MAERITMPNATELDALLKETDSIIKDTSAAIPMVPVYYNTPADNTMASDIPEIEEINIDKSKATILVVDDNASMLRSIKGILEADYNVVLANSGEKAFKQLKRCTPHLILLDYQMPKMDGAEVMRRLKDSPVTASIPVLFLSGVNDKDQIKTALSLEPYGYLLKPVSKVKLLETIAEILFATRRFK